MVTVITAGFPFDFLADLDLVLPAGPLPEVVAAEAAALAAAISAATAADASVVLASASFLSMCFFTQAGLRSYSMGGRIGG